MKFSKIATSILAALALTACGGSSSDSVITPPPGGGDPANVDGSFIDAAVEGLYYSAMPSDKSGYTDESGSYKADAEDTVTFFLGGKSGLKVGAASYGNVLTPFEAAGKYNRAVNLAIVLQTLGTESSLDYLTIPVELQGTLTPEIAMGLQALNLDSSDSVTHFLTEIMDVAEDDIVTEDAAIAHMVKAFGPDSGIKRGSDDAILHLQKGSDKIIRTISAGIRATAYTGAPSETYVHADKMLPVDLFESNRGMNHMNFKLDDERGFVELAGGNDRSMSGDNAAKFLQDKFDNLGNQGGYNAYLSGPFSHKFPDKNGISEADNVMNWGELFAFLPFNKSAQQLNSFSDQTRDDGYDKEGEDWQREIASSSYDPITKIYTSMVKKIKLASEDGPATRTSERVEFYYAVDSVNAERYVDFKGTWVQSEICDDVSVAKANYKFGDDGLTFSGAECKDGTAEELEEEEKLTYAELANMDFWWFNQENRKSKATLAELNTVVRFCDIGGYTPGDVCINDDGYDKERFINWDYQPAGKDWDQGLLTRQKMDKDGTIMGMMTIQKVK